MLAFSGDQPFVSLHHAYRAASSHVLIYRKTRGTSVGWRSSQIQVTSTMACAVSAKRLLRVTDFGFWHRRPGTGQSWRAITARFLAFVLVMAVTVPTAGLSDDVAFHGGGRDSSTKMQIVSAALHADSVDQSLICHLHYNCRQIDSMAVVGHTMPCLEAVLVVYAQMSGTVLFIASGRLPRPPRA